MHMSRKFWTQEEEAYLIENYSQLGKLCALKLGRTPQAVFAKASKLGLKSQAIRPSQAKTNSDYDEEILIRDLPLFRVGDYVNSKTPIIHECFEGHQWKTTPNHILNSNSSCPTCAGNIRRTTEEYKSLIPFEVLEPYVNKEVPILHKCSQGHEWKARPGHVIRGSGCPFCSVSGFKKDKPAILYYVKIVRDNETYYKIGISNNDIETRFKADKDKLIVPLLVKQFPLGIDAFNEEQKLLKRYAEFRQSINGFLNSKGNTELFETDILGLDNE